MLQPVLITIAYTVRNEKQDEFLSLMNGVADRINGQPGIEFSLFKVDGAEKSYVEVYSCDSLESYDALEDNLDETSRGSIAKIAADFAMNRQVFTAMRRKI